MSPPLSFVFHAELNSPGVIPAGWYRRNVAQYEILTYVNHVIALQLADDWENAALFVRRAAKYLASSDEAYLTSEYRALVAGFLQAFIADASHEDLGKFGPGLLDEARGFLTSLRGA